MTHTTAPHTTAPEAHDDLLDGLLAHVAAEDAEPTEVPEPVVVIAFPTVL